MRKIDEVGLGRCVEMVQLESDLEQGGMREILIDEFGLRRCVEMMQPGFDLCLVEGTRSPCSDGMSDE